jgi:hypothetical protein
MFDRLEAWGRAPTTLMMTIIMMIDNYGGDVIGGDDHDDSDDDDDHLLDRLGAPTRMFDRLEARGRAPLHRSPGWGSAHGEHGQWAVRGGRRTK